MPGHDVFLCYDSATDEPFARRFGALLATFGSRRLRHRRSVLRLAPRRTEALADSTWLVLLASPEAARSPQVADEVDRWLDRHGTDRLLIGLTRGGDISWAGHRPMDGTDTLPPALIARLRTEPRWVDLRDIARLDQPDAGDALVRECLATFAARLRGIEKDELIGEHVQRERRARVVRRAALSALSVLLGITLVLAGASFVEARRADGEARAADARLLAATALAVSDTDAERAVLLAAEGYRLHPDTQTFTALLRSVEATGPLERRVDLGGDVVALAAAPLPEHDADAEPEAEPDAGTVIAGTADGDVWRWRLDQEPERLASLDGPVTEVAVSSDGETVAAVAGGALWVAAPGSGDPGTTQPGTTGLTGVSDVAVAPDGERMAVIVWEDDDTHDLLLLDGTGRERTAAQDLSGTSLETVALTKDAVVVAMRRVPSGAGHWQRRSVPDLDLVREGGVVEPLAGEFTEHQVSPDGAWVTAFRGGAVFAADTTESSVYNVHRVAAPDALGPLLPVTATPAGGGADSLLLSRRDETWVVELPTWKHERATPLRGMPAADTAAFIDGDRVVTAHGGTLAAWDLASASPLTSAAETDNAYLADTALSPDGSRVATSGTNSFLDDTGRSYGTVASYHLTDGEDLRSTFRFRAVQPGRPGDRLLPVPLDDGRVLVVTPEDGTVGEATGKLGWDDLTTPVPVHPLEARYETGLRSVRAARVVGDRLVLADGHGRVQVRDALGGRLLHHATADHAATIDPWAVEAVVSPDGRYVAFHDLAPLGFTGREATISVLDLHQSRTRTLTVPVRQYVNHLGLRVAASVLDLTYGDTDLLVSQVDGVLVVEPDGAAVRTRIDSVVGSAAYTPSALAPVPGTSLVAQAGELDWIRLYDTRTGEQVGSLTLPDAGGTVQPLWLGAGPDSLLALSGPDAVRWDLRPAALLAAACEFADRDLTVREWTQTVGTAAPQDLTCGRDL